MVPSLRLGETDHIDRLIHQGVIERQGRADRNCHAGRTIGRAARAQLQSCWRCGPWDLDLGKPGSRAEIGGIFITESALHTVSLSSHIPFIDCLDRFTSQLDRFG